MTAAACFWSISNARHFLLVRVVALTPFAAGDIFTVGFTIVLTGFDVVVDTFPGVLVGAVDTFGLILPVINWERVGGCGLAASLETVFDFEDSESLGADRLLPPICLL